MIIYTDANLLFFSGLNISLLIFHSPYKNGYNEIYRKIRYITYSYAEMIFFQNERKNYRLSTHHSFLLAL
ncbi:MAG: hypothetical protein DRN27_09400 [Thermoplasmata archaeon]|nr:MAG: hypothetical protein DRN27_09400 [Thermoplasmata archaeon]